MIEKKMFTSTSYHKSIKIDFCSYPIFTAYKSVDKWRPQQNMTKEQDGKSKVEIFLSI